MCVVLADCFQFTRCLPTLPAYLPTYIPHNNHNLPGAKSKEASRNISVAPAHLLSSRRRNWTSNIFSSGSRRPEACMMFNIDRWMRGRVGDMDIHTHIHTYSSKHRPSIYKVLLVYRDLATDLVLVCLAGYPPFCFSVDGIANRVGQVVGIDDVSERSMKWTQ